MALIIRLLQFFVVEKNQVTKQNNSSSSKRGEKRNSRVKPKSRCDPFSLKNGMVGLNSAAGGNNFLGMNQFPFLQIFYAISFDKSKYFAFLSGVVII